MPDHCPQWSLLSTHQSHDIPKIRYFLLTLSKWLSGSSLYRHTWKVHENSYCQVLSQCFRMLVWGRAWETPSPTNAQVMLTMLVWTTLLRHCPRWLSHDLFFLPRLLTRILHLYAPWLYLHTLLSRDFLKLLTLMCFVIWGGPLGAVLLQWVNC